MSFYPSKSHEKLYSSIVIARKERCDIDAMWLYENKRINERKTEPERKKYLK